MTALRKQLRLDNVDVIVLDIALRQAAGRPISPADDAYLAQHLGTLSALWSQVNAYRNFFHPAGE